MESTRKLHSRKGDICMINEQDTFDTFCADLVSYTITPKTITAEYTEKVGSSDYHLSSYKRGDANLSIVFYVEGTTEETMYINASNLIVAGKKCIINIAPNEFLYNAILTNSTVEKLEIEHFAKVTLTFVATITLPLRSVTFANGTGMLRNIGSVESGARYIITSTTDLTELKINDITVKNIIKNMPFIIDGIEGKITSNDINRFLDTNLIDFPKVVAGENEITCDKTVSVTVEYYPTFIV